jgi:hypothetical protein
VKRRLVLAGTGTGDEDDDDDGSGYDGELGSAA